MKKIILAAVAAAAMAAPAAAEYRAEVRGGMAFGYGDSAPVVGVGGGYDHVMDSGFVGIDVGADKVFEDGVDVVFSVGARAGAAMGEGTKLYGTVGLAFEDGSDLYAGIGAQKDFGETTYGKLELRRFFNSGKDINALVVGVGMKF